MWGVALTTWALALLSLVLLQMDQDLARSLFEEGAALVLLDVPARTEFGIDYNYWTVGPKFKGVKMIPPGFHFVFYRCRVECSV